MTGWVAVAIVASLVLPRAGTPADVADVARAIERATEDPMERRVLLVLAAHESGFMRWVIDDHPRCRDGVGGVCDGGRAWSPWQLHGTDRSGGLQCAARLALYRIRYYARHCERVDAPCGYGPQVYAAYATGGRCTWAGATRRWEDTVAIRVPQ